MNSLINSKKLFMLFKTAFLLTVAFLLIMSNSANAGNEKVNICHLPAGDQDKMIDLKLPQSAAAAHIQHGDYLGTCQQMLEPPVVYGGLAF